MSFLYYVTDAVTHSDSPSPSVAADELENAVELGEDEIERAEDQIVPDLDLEVIAPKGPGMFLTFLTVS